MATDGVRIFWNLNPTWLVEAQDFGHWMSKNRCDRCCRRNKASIQYSKYSQKNNLHSTEISVPEFLQSRNKWVLNLGDTRNYFTWKKVYYENTSSSCIHVSSIDQGATRLGGYSSVHAKMGAPLFLKLYLSMNIEMQTLKSPLGLLSF